MTQFRLVLLAVVALLAAGLVAAGCGGDSGGDEDPQQVLDETFNGKHDVTSGVIDVSLSGSAEGKESGSGEATISGPFQAGQNGELPQLDLTASAKLDGGGQNIDVSGGIANTADDAFLSYEDKAYRVPAEFVAAFQQGYENAQKKADKGGDKNADNLLDQYGVEPQNWLTNLTNEGDADVEGTNTTHIHGDADVAKMVEDLQSVAEQAGGDVSIDPLTDKDVKQIEDAVDEASIDVYSGADDRILRKLDVNLALTSPQSESSDVDSVDASFSITLADVNEDQDIEAPSDVQSFDDLGSALGLPPGLLEQMLSGGGSSLGGSVDGGGSSGGGTITPQSGAADQKYLKCISKAQTPEELQACEP